MKAVVAAKHHTVIATEAGEVFTWGSNRGKCFPDIHIAIFTNTFSYLKQLILFQMLISLILLGVLKLSCFLVCCNLVHMNWSSVLAVNVFLALCLLHIDSFI